MPKDPAKSHITPDADTEFMAVGVDGFLAKVLGSDLVTWLASAFSAVPSSRVITAGAGLTGGGDLSADRTINVAAGNASISVAADSISVGFDDTTDPVQLTDSTTGADGTAVVPARRDHRHGLAAHLTSAALAAAYAAIGRTLTAGAGLTGGGTLAADRTFNVVAANGSITVNADSIEVGYSVSAPAAVTPSAGSAGAAATAARSDHSHQATVAAPVAVGTANAAGSAASLARSDHVHDHGAQTSGTLHAAATTGVAGFMSAADKAKLDEILPGTYTPTYSNLTNLTSATHIHASYHHMDTVTIIVVRAEVVTTGAGPVRSFELTVPVDPGANFADTAQGVAPGATNATTSTRPRASTVAGAKRFLCAFNDATAGATIQVTIVGAYLAQA